MCGRSDCRSQGKHPIGQRGRGDGWMPPLARGSDLPAGANLGLLTGVQSGVFALDVDPKSGGDELLRELIAQHGELPPTWFQRTGSGGTHFLFTLPDDFTPTNSRGRLPVGLDIRGEGGQIVLAPSVSGIGPYECWVAATGVLPAPGWLCELIRPLPPARTESWTGGLDYGLAAPGGRGQAYAVAAISAEGARLAGAAPGERNQTAFRVACRLIELAWAEWSGLTMEAAWSWYMYAGAGLTGPDFTERELRGCWSSAMRKIREQPALLPPPPGGAPAFLPFEGGMPPFSLTGGPAASAPLAPVMAGPGSAGPSASIPGDPFSAALPVNGSYPQAVHNPDMSNVDSTSPQPEIMIKYVNANDQSKFDSPVDPVAALMARLLTTESLLSQPNPEYLVDGLMELDSETWIIAPSGGFKSFVVLDIANHVAAGRPWQGLRVRQGRVVYVVAEGRRGMKLRHQAWLRTYGDAGDIVFLPEPVQAGNPAAWAVLVEACRRLEPVLVVLDTQARVTVGLEENSARDMGIFVEAVRALKAATGACVAIVHHTGRRGGDARGSSALDGAQDTEVRIERKGRTMRAVVSLDKQKEGRDDVKIKVRLQAVDLGTDERTGRGLSSLVLSPVDPFADPIAADQPEWFANLTTNQGYIMAAMRDHSDEVGATQTQLMRWLKERGTPLGQSSVSTAVKALVESELLERLGVGRIRLSEEGSE